MSILEGLIKDVEGAGKEKHLPIIECPDKVKAGEPFEVKITVGKEVRHPNTLEHHIVYIDLYHLKGRKDLPVLIGRYQFEATKAEPIVTTTIILEESTTLLAIEYCNLHGLWEYTREVAVE